ncbi:MAG: cytochrome c [Pseudomonadota bacterium]
MSCPVKALATMAAITVFSTSAFAAGDAPKERQEIMRNVGAATKVTAGMARGQVPFDAVAAQMALKTMHSAALGFGYMFPEGSESGSNTEASSKIWSDRAGFDKLVNKFVADTSAKVTDLESLRQAFGGIAANCSACHKVYREKK